MTSAQVPSRDLGEAAEVGHAPELGAGGAGTVSVNDILTHYMAMGLPVGGLKSSGIGARHGAEGIRKFCERRATWVSRWHLRRDIHTYPYSPARSRLLLRTLKLMYGSRRGLGR